MSLGSEITLAGENGGAVSAGLEELDDIFCEFQGRIL